MIAGESICALCVEITMDTTTGVRFNTPKCRYAITMPHGLFDAAVREH